MSSTDPPPRKLKVLMLHGYTQSGPLFHAKTRALEKLLMKSFPSTPLTPLKAYPGGVQLIYPTAPINLRPADIPGYTAPSPAQAAEEIEEDFEAWGWWRKSDSTGLYSGIETGLSRIADTIRQAGGVDGVIGFSQGAAAAVMVASLLDEKRLAAWTSYAATHPDAFPYPSSFLSANSDAHSNSNSAPPEQPGTFHPPLKFVISYAGFLAPHPSYAPFYTPLIQTKSLHFIGTLDSVVEEERSLRSARACVGWGEEGGKENVVYHAGGHFVPIGKEMAGVLVGFIKEVCGKEEGGGEKGVGEEAVEDMDVPF